MIVIIPLCGIGKRFTDNGYHTPKALINIHCKPIIYHLIEGLNIDIIKYIYIPYNKVYDKYNFRDRLSKDFPNIIFKFITPTGETCGAADTLRLAIKELDDSDDDMPILSLDSDCFYNIDIISKWNGENKIFYFIDKDNKPIYSYIEKNDTSVTNIIEKQKISNMACSGAYGFNSYRELYHYITEYIGTGHKQNGEFYISGVINHMIKNGIHFTPMEIKNENYFNIGTPLALRQYYNGVKHTQNKRICFDLDNTLVTYPTIKGDYNSVEPIQKNIDLLNYLHGLGNTIIIYTARRMKTHNGNIGSVNKDIGLITFNTLDRFGIKYDEIYFGKPYADFYIDDCAVNAFSDIEKEIGCYNTNNNPRPFHTITYNDEIVTKKGDNLDGEIYYYKNIPDNISDYFPKLISYGNNEYSTEKIDGITISTMYINRLLKIDHFKDILNIIETFHSIPNDDININKLIYVNYCDKIKKRYSEYNYTQYSGHKNMYDTIIDSLVEYENNDMGVSGTIHGDPVFTNIILTTCGKYKFIDMRGKLGDKHTIYGDIFYDYAKIYQSLIGYDNIINGLQIDDNYCSVYIEYFNKYICSKFSDRYMDIIKKITKAHIFSLIPLHNKYNDMLWNLLYSPYLKINYT